MASETETPTPPPAKLPEPSETDMHWALAAIARKWPAVKNYIVHLACFVAGALVILFLYEKFIIPGKDASIEAKQNQIDQLKFVQELASNLTNVYQSLDANLKNIAVTVSNSQPIIQFYIQQATVLKSQLDDKANEVEEMKGRLDQFSDRRYIPNLLGAWAFTEFTNHNYWVSEKLIEACSSAVQTMHRNDFTKSGMIVIHLTNCYMTNQTQAGEMHFKDALTSLTDANISDADEARDEVIYLGLIKPYASESLRAYIEDNRRKAWGYYLHLTNP